MLPTTPQPVLAHASVLDTRDIPTEQACHIKKLEARVQRLESMLTKVLDHIGLSNEYLAEVTLNGNSIIPHDEPSSIVMNQITEPTIYTYTPLALSESQIRILRIHRAENLSDPLITSLETASLDQDPIQTLMYGFTALSYTWGPPVFDGLVILNGCAFPVTRSLEAALRQLRWSYKDNAALEINGRVWGKECYVWVDQICELLFRFGR